MHLRKLQAVLGLGGPCQSSSQGRRADRADGVVHLHSGSDLVSPDGSSIAPLSVPALVHQEGRTIVRRYVDDPEAGQLPGKNPTTASRTVWPENLDRPGHRASQPNRVSDTSTEDPASSTSSRSIRRGEFHPPGRSRTPSKSTKRERRAGLRSHGIRGRPGRGSPPKSDHKHLPSETASLDQQSWASFMLLSRSVTKATNTQNGWRRSDQMNLLSQDQTWLSRAFQSHCPMPERALCPRPWLSRIPRPTPPATLY